MVTSYHSTKLYQNLGCIVNIDITSDKNWKLFGDVSILYNLDEKRIHYDYGGITKLKSPS